MTGRGRTFTSTSLEFVQFAAPDVAVTMNVVVPRSGGVAVEVFVILNVGIAPEPEVPAKDVSESLVPAASIAQAYVEAGV